MKRRRKEEEKMSAASSPDRGREWTVGSFKALPQLWQHCSNSTANISFFQAFRTES